MNIKLPVKNCGRRRFLARTVPTCAALALGSERLMAMTMLGDDADAAEVSHKFLAQSEMTFEIVYRFAFSNYAGMMKVMRDEIGNDKFMETLRGAANKLGTEYGKKQAESVPRNDLAGFVTIPEKSKRFCEHVLTTEVVESSDSRHQIKITECLWAKTFRHADAADIGYATICYPDFAMAEGYNPKLKLLRTKTLMQGDDCCDHCWVMKA